MASNFPTYSLEDENSCRISKILIDVGGEVLRKQLEKHILNESKSLDANRPECKSVEEYFNQNAKTYKDKKKFFKNQIDTMYPKGTPTRSCEKFDITLCANLLLENLIRKPKTGWPIEPLPNDNSIGANIMRLKIIRNVNWAHIHKFGCTLNELKRLKEFSNTIECAKDFSILAKLEFAIYGLCSNKKEKKLYEKAIYECCNCSLDEKTVTNLRDTINNLVAKDTETNEYILRTIEKLGETFGANLGTKLADIKLLIQENRKLDKDDFNQVKTNQEKLFHVLNDKFEDILSRCEFYDDFKNEVNSKLDFILEKQKKISVDNNNMNCKQINIEDFKGYFEEENVLSFKILLLDYEQLDFEKFNKENLVNSIAFSKWNIIIDLNSNRKNHGIDNDICEAYEKYLKMNFLKKKIEESESITASDKHCIMKGSLLCYFIMNDSTNHNISDSYSDDFQIFLEKINISQRAVMCTNLFLRNVFPYSSDYISKLEEINKAIRKAIYRSNKQETVDLIYIFFDDLDNFELTEDIKRLIGKDLQNIEKRYLQENFKNSITNMAPNLRIEEKFHYLPCIDGSKMEWSEKMNSNYSSFIEVYHDKIGKGLFRKIYKYNH